MAIRNSMEGATAERKELTVNSAVQIRKKRRRPSRAVSHPVAGSAMALAARYEVSTHETSSSPAESAPWMWGRATLVTLVSRTWSTDTSMTVTVMAQRRALPSGGRPRPARPAPLPARPRRQRVSVGMGCDDSASRPDVTMTASPSMTRAMPASRSTPKRSPNTSEDA